MRSGHLWSQGWASDALAHAVALSGDVDRAQAYSRRSLLLFEQAGDERGIAWAFNGLADVARLRGDLRAAGAHADRAAMLAMDLADARALAWALELLATASADGAPRRALALLGASGHLRSSGPAIADLEPTDLARAARGRRRRRRPRGRRARHRADDARALAALIDEVWSASDRHGRVCATSAARCTGG